MSTAMCAVKVRDCLIAAMAAHDAARRLPIIRKVSAACRADIFEMAELVSRVVDIPASRALGKDARTGAHICVNHGVSADLDALRADYQQMENVLTDAAQYARAACNPTRPGCSPTLRGQAATVGAQDAILRVFTQVRAGAAAHGRPDGGRAGAGRGALRHLRAAGEGVSKK